MEIKLIRFYQCNTVLQKYTHRFRFQILQYIFFK
uniref:Uncharacterized protein n=1 Tax=Anguilla anguilla TaxID=7936 RepID=A0A0E9T1A1_ANGAN